MRGEDPKKGGILEVLRMLLSSRAPDRSMLPHMGRTARAFQEQGKIEGAGGMRGPMNAPDAGDTYGEKMMRRKVERDRLMRTMPSGLERIQMAGRHATSSAAGGPRTDEPEAIDNEDEELEEDPGRFRSYLSMKAR